MTAGKKPSDEELLLDVELLTIQQVATWAKVSTKSIYRWIEAGKIPVVKIGKRTYRIPARFLFSVRKPENNKGRMSGKRRLKRLLCVRAERLYTERHE